VLTANARFMVGRARRTSEPEAVPLVKQMLDKFASITGASLQPLTGKTLLNCNGYSIVKTR